MRSRTSRFLRALLVLGRILRPSHDGVMAYQAVGSKAPKVKNGKKDHVIVVTVGLQTVHKPPNVNEMAKKSSRL